MTIRRFIMFISYMTLKLLQTFIYAWYGNLITSAVSVDRLSQTDNYRKVQINYFATCAFRVSTFVRGYISASGRILVSIVTLGRASS